MTPLDSIFENDFGYIIKQTKYNNLPQKLQLTYPDIPDPDYPADFQIAQLFRPLFLLMKITLSSPVKISKKDGNLKYEHRYLSWNFILSVVAGGLISGISLLLWILNTVCEIDYPLKIFRSVDQTGNWINADFLMGSSLLIVLNKLIKISYPFGAWILLVLQCTNVGYFCKFVNSWPTFFKDFEKAFSPYYKYHFDLRRQRNLYCFFWFSPMILLFLAVRPINGFDIGMPEFVGVTFMYWQSMSVFFARTLSYVKDFLILQTLKTAFEEIRNGVRAQYEHDKFISRKTVQEWMHLITFVRKQQSDVENYLSLPNFWSIFEVFLSVLLVSSMVVFLFLNNKLKEVGANFLPYALFSTAFFTISVYCKASIAEAITVKEESIAEQIVQMDVPEKISNVRLEMKLICDLIYNDPTIIHIWNMLTLNKRLLLTFFSQLASYLVVLLQFTKL